MSDVATALLQLIGRAEPAADPALAAVKLARATIDALILRMGQSIDAKVTAQLPGGLTQFTAGADSFVLKLEMPLAVNTPVTLRIAPAPNGQPAVTVTLQPQPIAAQPAQPAPLPATPLPVAPMPPPVPKPQFPGPAAPPQVAAPPMPPAAQVLTPAPSAPLPTSVSPPQPTTSASTPPPAPQPTPAQPAQAIPPSASPLLPPAPVPQAPIPPPPASQPAAAPQPSTPAPPPPLATAAPLQPATPPAPVAPTTIVPVATPPSIAPPTPPAQQLAAPAPPVTPPPSPTPPPTATLTPAPTAATPAPTVTSAPNPVPAPAPLPQATPSPVTVTSLPMQQAATPTAPPSTPGAPVAVPAPSATSATPTATPPTTTPPTPPSPQAAVPPVPPSRPAVPPPASPPLTQILADPVQAAARQDSVLPLIARLAALSAPTVAALPRPALEAIARVLAARLDLNRAPPDGKAIREAVLRAGIVTEPGTRAPADAKSALLQLRSALSGFLGGEVEAVAPVTRRPPPPLKGQPVRSPAPQPAGPTPEEPLETARQLLGHTDAALSRTKLLQLASNTADASRPNIAAPAAEFRVEVPMQLGAETGILQLLVERDGKHKRTQAERGWRMRFALNFTTTGEVGAEIALLGRSASVALWAAEPATADALEDMLPELGPALARHGLDVGSVRVRRGAPPPAARAPGQLLDSAR